MGFLFFFFFLLHNCWRKHTAHQHSTVNELSLGFTAVLSVLHMQLQMLTTSHLGCPDTRACSVLVWCPSESEQSHRAVLSMEGSRPLRYYSARQAELQMCPPFHCHTPRCLNLSLSTIILSNSKTESSCFLWIAFSLYERIFLYFSIPTQQNITNIINKILPLYQWWLNIIITVFL